MRKEFAQAGADISYKQMKELSRKILSSAFVSDNDNATEDFELGTGVFDKMKKFNFLAFYFLLFHELSHNFHDLWGENFGVPVMSGSSIAKRSFFDEKGANSLETMGEFLADIMAIYVTTELGLETKQVIGDLRKSDVKSARHEILTELFGNFPSLRLSPLFLKDFGEYVGKGVFGFFRNSVLLAFPWRSGEQHLMARRFVKEIIDNEKAHEQIPEIISTAYGLIGLHAGRLKRQIEGGNNEAPWGLAWKQFQNEIRKGWTAQGKIPAVVGQNFQQSGLANPAMNSANLGGPGVLPKMIDKGILRKGGIDFNADKINLQIQNATGGIKFHMDPAMLQQLQNAPGFVPVIINIQPMKDLRQFLGLADNQPESRQLQI